MIYGEMTEKVNKHTIKTLVHRQTKTTDFDNFNKDLLDAPWHVGEIFDDLDDAYDYWRNLFDSIANEHAPMRKKRVRERDVCFMSKERKAAVAKQSNANNFKNKSLNVRTVNEGETWPVTVRLLKTGATRTMKTNQKAELKQ